MKYGAKSENLNDLLHLYLPEGYDLGKFIDEGIQQIEDKLNRCPRKQLGYRAPEQVFELPFKLVALCS